MNSILLPLAVLATLLAVAILFYYVAKSPCGKSCTRSNRSPDGIDPGTGSSTFLADTDTTSHHGHSPGDAGSHSDSGGGFDGGGHGGH